MIGQNGKQHGIAFLNLRIVSLKHHICLEKKKIQIYANTYGMRQLYSFWQDSATKMINLDPWSILVLQLSKFFHPYIIVPFLIGFFFQHLTRFIFKMNYNKNTHFFSKA